MRKKKKKVLYLANGSSHGTGWLARALIAAIRRIADYQITPVSNANGLDALQATLKRVRDLALPADAPFLVTQCKYLQQLQRCEPTVVIAHDDYAALSAAFLLDIPTIALSSWLPQIGSLGAEALAYATALFVLAEDGLYPMPPHVTTRRHFCGAIASPQPFAPRKRQKLSGNRGVSADLYIMAVVSAGHEGIMVIDQVLSAFYMLEQSNKRLIWICGSKVESLKRRFNGLGDISATVYTSDAEAAIISADIVLAFDEATLAGECSAMGIPTLYISTRATPMEDVRAFTYTAHRSVYSDAINSSTLVALIQTIAKKSDASNTHEKELLKHRNFDTMVQALVAEIRVCR